jgi:hypothetical protein
MTALSRDSITIQENVYSIYSLPLESYWKQKGSKPPFFSLDSGCRRGYVAMWLIEEKKNFLVDFYGELFSDTGYEEYSLSKLFPDSDGKVFASWFTGEIIIPMGKPADYQYI